MVAYEDLVVALTNWRINQGLPTGTDAFAAFETGSVDLALPVADPVDTGGAELATDDGVEEVADASESFEADSAPGALEEADGFESFAEDETAIAIESAAELSVESVAEPTPGAEIERNLDFADDQTAFGDMPEMDGMDEMDADAPTEAAEAAELDDYRTEEVDVLASENEVNASEPITADNMAIEEEIDADDMEAEAINADDMEAEAINADDMEAEAINADDMEAEAIDADAPSSEEINTEPIDAIGEADADDFGVDETPTKFGEEDDNESTVMGIGVDEFVPPDEG